MTLRRQYLIAGLAWAFLLGPTTALSLFGFAAGVSWLWLFGDDPWPAATQWVLPLIGFVGGLLIALACVIGGILYGRRRSALTSTNPQRERRYALLFIAVPLLLIALLGAKTWWEGEQYSRTMALVHQREAAFSVLLGARHEIKVLTIGRTSNGSFRATAQLNGQREGDYRFQWQVSGTSFGAALASGEQTIHLQSGTRSTTFAFTLDELAHGYKSKVLSGAGSVLVEEPFRLEVSLLPMLSGGQRQALPPGERYRLDAGDTPLRAEKITVFPVRFVIRSDGSIGP